MKYIKKFENIPYDNNQGVSTDAKDVYIPNILDYLGIDMFQPLDESTELKSVYDVDVVEFLKEIFLGKHVQFKSINKLKDNPIVSGNIIDIKLLFYQDEVYVKFLLENKYYKKEDWYIVSNGSFIFLPTYDADNKPLHKDVKMKKEAEKYNI